MCMLLFASQGKLSWHFIVLLDNFVKVYIHVKILSFFIYFVTCLALTCSRKISCRVLLLHFAYTFLVFLQLYSYLFGWLLFTQGGKFPNSTFNTNTVWRVILHSIQRKWANMSCGIFFCATSNTLFMQIPLHMKSKGNKVLRLNLLFSQEYVKQVAWMQWFT